MKIEQALPKQAAELSRVSLAAKSDWAYSYEVIKSWQQALVITADSIRSNLTFVAIEQEIIVGFYQLKVSATTTRLEHLWVLPEHMGKGVGRGLLQHASRMAKASLIIDSDPHAENFYLACGALRVSCIAAPIAGQPDRFLPRMELPYVAV
ncbi:GNAT family N-acetyltransferase [Paraglaciecola sp.]|uniref:GNAT family N-acetyltransferase n=1 Tax=Paraglaciecola sp. TaxID=1920173 RepID=UPI0030F407A4